VRLVPLALVLLASAGCSSAVPVKDDISFEVRNTTEQPLYGFIVTSAPMGIPAALETLFSTYRPITIKPGESYPFSIPRTLIPRQIILQVVAPKGDQK